MKAFVRIDVHLPVLPEAGNLNARLKGLRFITIKEPHILLGVRAVLSRVRHGGRIA